jgi:hypothetical protein
MQGLFAGRVRFFVEAVEMDTRYLDDLHAGQRFESGGITLTEAEIIDFAWRYDPSALSSRCACGGRIALWRPDCQRFPERGRVLSACSSRAACWQTARVMGSPGIDELRWLAPVRPGRYLAYVKSKCSKSEALFLEAGSWHRAHEISWRSTNVARRCSSFIVMHLLRRRQR